MLLNGELIKTFAGPERPDEIICKSVSKIRAFRLHNLRRYDRIPLARVDVAGWHIFYNYSDVDGSEAAFSSCLEAQQQAPANAWIASMAPRTVNTILAQEKVSQAKTITKIDSTTRQ